MNYSRLEMHSSLLEPFISYEENQVVDMDSGTLFTTLHYLHNLPMSPISERLLHYTKPERLARADKHSSLLGPFLSYEENEELWIWTQK